MSVELPNGTVLVAGGTRSGPSSLHGELLAADGSAFTPAGTMTQARLYGAATLLSKSRVLVAGGDTSLSQSTPVPTTAEVWSPAGGGTFTATGAMHVSRQAFALTTLPTGLALAAGGSPELPAHTETATAELYNPATNKWTLTGSMPAGRQGDSATLLPSCKVLIVGDNPSATTYNYATGTFSPGPSEGAFQRSYQTATLLASGKVLIAGGETVTGVGLATASVYNPATGTFTPTANNMSSARVQGFAARLPDGRVVVGGGFTSGGLNPPDTPTVDIYNPATNKFSPATSLPGTPFAAGVPAQALHNGKVAVMSVDNTATDTDIYTPDAGGSPASPPPLNCTGLFSIMSTTAGSRGAIKLKLGVPSGGSVKATATAPVQKGVPHPLAYGHASASVAHYRVLTMTISPNSTARGVLQSRGTLRVRVTATFTPLRGSSVHRVSSVRAHWP
ncbi:MAG: hypothetical protein ACJ764_07230 [Solirubrobacteraceae bacterium]